MTASWFAKLCEGGRQGQGCAGRRWRPRQSSRKSTIRLAEYMSSRTHAELSRPLCGNDPHRPEITLPGSALSARIQTNPLRNLSGPHCALRHMSPGNPRCAPFRCVHSAARIVSPSSAQPLGHGVRRSHGAHLPAGAFLPPRARDAAIRSPALTHTGNFASDWIARPAPG